MSAPSTELIERVQALRAVVLDGGDVFPHDPLQEAAHVVGRAEARLRHGTAFTVVALAGATGSGKSSLFNALVGEPVSPVGVTRPTTDRVRAAVFGPHSPDSLLQWLEVRHRHGASARGLDGLVLLDLPDHDSIETHHRLEVDRLVELVDLMVWVLDPQKYADEALHARYLTPLSDHAGSMLFVLNQSDLVSPGDRRRWIDHATSLLHDDGIESPEVLAVSAVTGDGIPGLRGILEQRIESREAALARLDADLRKVAGALGPVPEVGDSAPALRKRLDREIGEAAGADIVADAVAAGYRFDATRRTGWPFARWLLRFRRHPLRALRPTAPPTDADGPAKPTAIPIDESRLDLAIHSYADGRTPGADPRWSRRARAAATSRRSDLPAVLGDAVQTAARESIAPPRWWNAVAWLQRVFATIAVAGAVWLALLLVLEYLRVPTEDLTPDVGSWPVPTLLLLAGGLAGVVTALVARVIAAVGANRRARRSVAALHAKIREAAEIHVVAPLDTEVATWAELAHQLDVAAGTSPS